MKNLFVIVVSLFALSVVGCAHKGGHGHGKKKSHEMWKMMDADSDGTVTRAEFDKAHDEKFKKMDADGDGKITKEEKKAHKKAMKEGKKGCCGN